MNPLTVITHTLQSIPATARKYILLAYSLVVVTVAVLNIAGVDLDYDTINTVLVLIGGYLGFQSAANVSGEHDETG
jgi:hypothetical protein